MKWHRIGPRCDKDSIPILTVKVVLFSLFLFLQSRIWLRGAFVPDEQWFLRDAQLLLHEMKECHFHCIFNVHNRLGYGAIYWIGLSLALLIKSSWIWVRGLVLALESLFIAFYLFRRGKHHVLSALLLLGSQPFWWYGKLIGPEIVSAILCGFALIFIFDATFRPTLFSRVGWVLLGLAIGIKLTSIPVAVFAICLVFERGFRSFLIPTLLMGAGFVISNPFLLISPSAFLIEIQRYTGATAFTWGHLKSIYFGSGWEWDAIYSGGLLDWIISPICLGLLLVLTAFLLPLKFVGGFLTALLVTTVMFLSNSIFKGWYWLNFLVIFPFLISKIPVKPWTTALVCLCVGINILWSFPRMVTQYQLAKDHVRNVENTQLIRTQLLEKLHLTFQPQLVVDLSEIPSEIGDVFSSLQKTHGLPHLTGWEAYRWFTGISKSKELPALILVGDRVNKFSPFGNPAAFVSSRTEGRVHMEVLERFDFFTVYKVGTH